VRYSESGVRRLLRGLDLSWRDRQEFRVRAGM